MQEAQWQALEAAGHGISKVMRRKKKQMYTLYSTRFHYSYTARFAISGNDVTQLQIGSFHISQENQGNPPQTRSQANLIWKISH